MPELKADGVVLGAGMVGVGAALHLQQRGRDVMLVDRHNAAGEVAAIDQDDVAPSLLQMQGGADADHACTQYENVGLEFRHSALRKLNVFFLPQVKLATAARSRKPP